MRIQEIWRRTRIQFSVGAIAFVCSCSQLYADPNGAVPSAAAQSTNQPPANAPPGGPSETIHVPPEQAAADWLEKAFAGQQMPESVQMLAAIARGSQMGPGEGWFGPGQTRYDWKWLARTTGAEAAAEIAPEQLRGPKEFFDRLDRNRDGRVTASDLDWSDRNPYVQQYYLVSRILRRMNKKGDGRLTRDEVLAFFDRAASGREYATSADLAETLLAGFGSGAGANDGPTAETLVRGLFRGEIGSLNAGPALNAAAPDFSLKTQDGKQTIRLGELGGPKPIVLVFGNFTCGPFRSMYPLVDELCKRYQDRATFLAVYVREAHPTDGWRMESNDAVGVELAQPATYDERVAVAQRCQATLNYSMPLVVDEINDPVGNAYSGMPARLYLIDCEGKVAYKSGRGPFGFKPGELEQALVLLLLDQQLNSAPPIAETTE
ncbi:MAG TPA: deiodinase family protein [Pirellulales bacterium]|nr:deiodinase family protein [Pirellulales bacterium]